ncbi:TetR family transcriptional regulator [Schleiferia thermophila]|uniref:TetR family transcriptional regulator n=2 Tax=Schleiferia thermophila TaxID=884107 RepID=A0A369A1S3_9FLAO|nr:TetR family transcriptional regulator [Schleiferia thermophila]
MELIEQLSPEQQILAGAVVLFSRLGLRSVTMDDLARELGISKKTLYKYYRNKADLVDKGAELVIDHIKEFCGQICPKEENPIDELFILDEGMRNFNKMQHQGVQFQLRKYYPNTFFKIKEAQRKNFMEVTTQNLVKGIEQGWYRNDFDVEIIANLHYSRILMIMDEQYFPVSEFDWEKLTREALIYHIRGIASAKGLEYLENKYSQKSNEQR